MIDPVTAAAISDAHNTADAWTALSGATWPASIVGAARHRQDEESDYPSERACIRYLWAVLFAGRYAVIDVQLRHKWFYRAPFGSIRESDQGTVLQTAQPDAARPQPECGRIRQPPGLSWE